MPRGGQRGTEVAADFTGARLTKAHTVLFYRPGISLKKLEQVNDNHVRCTLAIAADCQPGIHPMRLATASGITELKRFMVGGSPEITEAEPNSDRSKPQAVTPPVTINGTVTNEDIDYFSFEVPAPARINFEVEAIRLGDTLFDPHIEVLDTRGAVLANADDTPLVRQDAAISHTFKDAGTYLVAVREASYLGNGSSRYRLHVGAFPRPQGVYPQGGPPGAELDVQWLGDAKLGKAKVTLPAALDTDAGLFATDESGISPSPVPFRLSALPQTLEAEPNDGQDKATVGAAPGAFNGIIAQPGDTDWFKFSAKKGQVFDTRLYARQLRSPLDSVMGVNKLGGGGVASNDDSGGPDSAFRFTVPDDGEYALYVHDLLKRGGDLYAYRVELTPVAPVLTLSTPLEQQHLAVPQGNRNAIVVNATRSDFGGPLNLALDGMPAGLTLHAPQMPGNVSSIPIVVEAAADAAVAATMSDVVGRHADEKQTIEGHLHQGLRLIEFRNSTMCEQIVTRMGVAVAEKAPFEVKIVEPKVPLTRRGQMNVKIVATRAAEFKQAISLRLLWNPPGIGSGTATIAGDMTETTLHVNASDGAALGTWPLVIVATADVGGSVQVASQVANLTVAEPFFDLAIERARVTQGEESSLLVKATKKQDFEGEATVTLRGLPGKVASPEGKLTKETTELVFAVKAEKDAPVGQYGGVHVQTTVMQNGEPIVFNSVNGVLMVDKPLPPKQNEPPEQKAAQKAAPNPQEKKKRVRERRPRPEGGVFLKVSEAK